TQKIAKFRGMKLLLIQPYISNEGKLQTSGSSIVAVDSVGAGEGECVLFTQGSSARLTVTTKGAPVDAVIVGIVDSEEVVSRLQAHMNGGSTQAAAAPAQAAQAPSAPAAAASSVKAGDDGIFET